VRLTRARLAAVTAGLTGSVVAGAAGASAVIGQRDQQPPPPGAFRPQPGSERLGALHADPLAGPRWAVRVYRGQTGLSCLEVGRLNGRSFGGLRPDGTVIDVPIEESGSCGDLDADGVQFGAVTLSSGANGGQGERTVLFGRAVDQVRGLKLQRAGDSRAVPLGPERTFIVVIVGQADPRAFELRADLEDGSTRSFGL